MHSETEGNWLLNSYFPLKKGLCVVLVSRKIADLKLTLKQGSEEKQHPHQAKKKMTAIIDHWSKSQHQAFKTHSTNSTVLFIKCLSPYENWKLLFDL